MIQSIVIKMINIVQELQEHILLDIEDVKQANHEKLLDRNDVKLEKMQQVANLKQELNHALAEAIQAGADINMFRDDVDNLEAHLLELSKLNAKLASIVLPVKEMYKDIINEISKANGGRLLEVHA